MVCSMLWEMLYNVQGNREVCVQIKQSMFILENTPGTAGGQGGRDRTLAVKSNKKNAWKSGFFSLKKKLPNFFCIYLLVMPNYWGKQIFAHGSLPEVGQNQKTERKRKKSDFSDVFLLFTASVRSRPPGPSAVPGVFY